MAYADNSLNVNRMNAKEGGSVTCMHDTVYDGKRISMTKMVRNRTGNMVRTPRGMIDILKQRGRYYPKMKVDDMRKELATHSDFINEKYELEYYLVSVALPVKFHCELNPIERCWSQAKRYTRAYCTYKIVGLRRNVCPGLDSVHVEELFQKGQKLYVWLSPWP